MKTHFKPALIISLSLLILGSQNLIAQKKQLKGLDEYLENTMKEWNVPGMGVSLIYNNELVYEKGFGVKSTETGEAVDEHSLFAIASNSKAYTATMLAMLVEEGKLKWTDKVQDYLPWFELYDPYVSAEMTIQDLLCHRSGLATFSGDLYWYGSNHSAEDVVKMARGLEPVFDFRAGYGYQNVMFIAAGLVIEEVSGKSWSEFCRERILDPLGMDNTLTSITEFTDKTNKTEPHNDVDGSNKVIDWVNWDNVVAAGGIVSSAHDDAQWLMMNLNGGIASDDTLLSSSSLQKLWEIHNPQPQNEWSRNFYDGRSLQGYGLGWQVMVYKGKRVIHHGGGYDGMISHTFFLPEDGIGGVVLTNNITSLSYFLMYELIDRLIGEKRKESWTAKVKPLIDAGAENDKAEAKAWEEAAVKGTKPSKSLEDYVGTYHDEYYGNVKVEVDGENLKFMFMPTPLFSGTLKHRHYDVFAIEWGEQMMLPTGTFSFILDKDGNIRELEVDVPNPDFDFTELNFKRLVK